ncbi:DUF1254 domain-containing protein [Nocardia sp. NPDC127579]|uniref:DUF1254 domain-containing protein n=1 Tax=Nocardia sp. NPDC127579 TaxID=3345402 RepID=UPI0036345E49
MESSSSPYRRRLSRRWLLGTAALAGLGLTACGGDDSAQPEPTAADELEDIAAEAYMFGYPLVLLDITRAATTTPNQFANAVTRPDPADRLMVRPNLDTLYSQAWLDLRAEPLVLQVPAIEPDRYWIMQIMDAWTNTCHSPSSVRPKVQPPGTEPPFTYLVTGPNWRGQVPEGMTQLAMPTASAWILGRIEVKSDHDAAAVAGAQQKLKLVPLTAWLGGRTESTGRPDAPTPGQIPPRQQLAALDSRTYFQRMCTLMAENSPAEADAPALRRFARIGIAPGAKIDTSLTETLDAGVRQAKSAIPVYGDPPEKEADSWTFSTDLGAYGTDYGLRARTAADGLGANLAEDAVYPTLFTEADNRGKPIRFRMHFPAGELPPVDAFWSLTAYDADNYLVGNAPRIYSIGHTEPVVPNPDGSVDLALQSADPGSAVPRGNWLPIPASGTFSLTLRMYAPRPAALDGTWQVPSLTPVS